MATAGLTGADGLLLLKITNCVVSSAMSSAGNEIVHLALWIWGCIFGGGSRGCAGGGRSSHCSSTASGRTVSSW